MLLNFADLLSSDEFAQRAQHPDFPSAFTRNSKLPLPALVAALMSMRSGSQQVSLDGFFAATFGKSAPPDPEMADPPPSMHCRVEGASRIAYKKAHSHYEWTQWKGLSATPLHPLGFHYSCHQINFAFNCTNVNQSKNGTHRSLWLLPQYICIRLSQPSSFDSIA